MIFIIIPLTINYIGQKHGQGINNVFSFAVLPIFIDRGKNFKCHLSGEEGVKFQIR
jgi:hypothetical protein